MFIVYGKPNCPFCSKAIDLLVKNKLKMVYIDISTQENAHIVKEFKDQSIFTVPQVYFNDRHIGGYSELATYMESKPLIKRTVIKRDGEEEPFYADKINSMVEWAVKDNSTVQWSEIVMDAMEKLGTGQLTADNIQQALIKSCLDKDSESHNKVAGRLLLGDLRKKVKSDRHDFTSFYHSMVKENYWIDMQMSSADLSVIQNSINNDRDYSYGYPTLRQFKDKYSLKDKNGNLLEHPQFIYMGIAMTRYGKYGVDEVIKYYDLISTHKLNLPSPQLSTTRTPSNAGVSCAVITGGDSLHGIEAAKHVAFLATAASAGIGIEMDVRSPKDDVRNGYAVAGGKLPHYRTLSATVKEVKQSVAEVLQLLLLVWIQKLKIYLN
jgi:ribonucleoside-diphosphate reductase alpha chain